MLKIGEFARICNVSPQTLRYYDEEGLLCPDRIDPHTGYRYYAPEKVELFRRIQAYKDVGFALEEIKELLRADPIRHHVLMTMKQREINRRVRGLQTTLSRLESLSGQQDLRGMEEMFVSRAQFEDQPEVLGIWELCGWLNAPADGDFPDPSVPLDTEMRESAPDRLVFLPNGAPWWMYCWSRGVLYWMSERPRMLMPNPFVLWEVNGERYMTVRFCVTAAYLDRGEDPVWLLYRQTKHAALTKAESHVRVDDTNLPLIPDTEVLGEWNSVAWTRDPMTFSQRDIPRNREALWILGMIFYENGICIRRVAHGTRMMDIRFTYARYENPTAMAQGAVLDPKQQLAEAYFLREVEGETYLFVQHKSGDYIYGGRTPIWYVFRCAGKVQNPPLSSK